MGVAWELVCESRGSNMELRGQRMEVVRIMHQRSN